jgi:hypothetical protein
MKNKTNLKKIFSSPLISFSVFITGMFMLLASRCEDGSTRGEEESKPISSSSTCTTCSDIDFGPLPAKKVFGLISNYRNNHWNGINRLRGMDFKGDTMDSRSVWFDLEKLKAFISTIEASVDKTSKKCMQHCDAKLGIRIYFGEYGPIGAAENLAPAPNSVFQGLHTLVMVPTYQDRSAIGTPKEHIDFDPRIEDLCTIVNTSLDSNTLELLALLPDVSAMNYGTLIPPPDPKNDPCTGARVMHLVDYTDLYRPSVCH